MRRCFFRRSRRRPPDRGAVIVEFALLLPVMAGLLFGIIEYGWVFYQQFNLAAAVRDGLRQGVTIPPSASPDPATTARDRAREHLRGLGLDPNRVTLNATYAGSIPTRTLRLSARMDYRKLIGFVPTPSRLQYEMTMMLELQ